MRTSDWRAGFGGGFAERMTRGVRPSVGVPVRVGGQAVAGPRSSVRCDVILFFPSAIVGVRRSEALSQSRSYARQSVVKGIRGCRGSGGFRRLATAATFMKPL
jgi:hypothetical protein